jgi:NADH dehydrogenase
MRVAVLGGGYAGVAVARRLEGSLDRPVVVVDDTGSHLVQHELHRVVRRPSVADLIDIPLEEVLDEAGVVEGAVTDVDPDEGVVSFADREDLSYTAGAVCIGAETAFYGLEGVEEHATPLKTIEDALAIRERFLEVCADDGHAVVGGAGLSGVQVAGELVALAEERDAAPTVTLLEREDRVAPRFDAEFGDAVRAALEGVGVDVRTGRTVAGADADGIDLAGDGRIEYDQFVWTGGIAGREAVGGGRPQVNADLRLGERTVGVGDAVRVVDANGTPVPASAQAAVRQAGTAATNVRRLVEDGDGVFDPRLERYTFSSPGWLVSVGDDAVGQVGPGVLTGTAARAVKATVGAGYLTGVGAVRKATDMVYEELGVGDEAADPPFEWPGDGDGDATEDGTA